MERVREQRHPEAMQAQLAPWSPCLNITFHSKELRLLAEMVDSRAAAKTEQMSLKHLLVPESKKELKNGGRGVNRTQSQLGGTVTGRLGVPLSIKIHYDSNRLLPSELNRNPSVLAGINK